MLEHVAGKSEVHRSVGEKIQVANIADNRLYAIVKEVWKVWPSVYRNAPPCPDMVDEIAIATAKIQNASI